MARMSSVSVGAFCAAAVPSVRRVPLSVARTMPADVGDSAPIALCASAMAIGRRWKLPTFNLPAHSAMYDATASGAAGNGHRACESHHAQNYRQSAR